MKRRPILLCPPRDPRLLPLWLESGPGRAWRWSMWTRSVLADSPCYEIASAARKRLATILRDYRAGRDQLAGKRLERLSGELRGALDERRRIRSRGGKATAQRLQEERRPLEVRLRREIRRLIANDRSLSNREIAKQLSERGFGRSESLRKKVALIKRR